MVDDREELTNQYDGRFSGTGSMLFASANSDLLKCKKMMGKV